MSLFYYIHGGKVLEPFSISLDGINEVSSDYMEQQTKYVQLSPAQVQFHLDNPNATASEVWNLQLASSVLTNEEIRKLRKEQYSLRSDSLYIAYKKKQEQGNNEMAETYRTMWLNEVELIESQYPYL